MSRKYPRNDSDKRRAFSRWWNVDNDSADVPLAGRSFQIRGSTARSMTADSLTGGSSDRYSDCLDQQLLIVLFKELIK